MNRKAQRLISYGLYIISSKRNQEFNGQIANTVVQVTSDPATIAISINKENLTHDFIAASRQFSVSILSEAAPMTFIGLYGFKSGKDVKKFDQNIHYKTGVTGCPIVLDYSVAYLEAEVINEMDCGTHTMFLGRIVDADVLSSPDKPMTYEYYHNVKGGKSPKTAPTYAQEEPARKLAEKAAQYTCAICGYVYDPEKGDPDSGVPAGTPFESLPDDWTCPICGAAKDQFEKTT